VSLCCRPPHTPPPPAPQAGGRKSPATRWRAPNAVGSGLSPLGSIASSERSEGSRAAEAGASPGPSLHVRLRAMTQNRVSLIGRSSVNAPPSKARVVIERGRCAMSSRFFAPLRRSLYGVQLAKLFGRAKPPACSSGTWGETAHARRRPDLTGCCSWVKWHRRATPFDERNGMTNRGRKSSEMSPDAASR
jgi:hypothetical protein